MPASSSCSRRPARRVGDMSGTPRWRSLKRRLPQSSSRRTSGVHRSATISAALATGQNWPYPFITGPSVVDGGGRRNSIFVLFGLVGGSHAAAHKEVPHGYSISSRD